MKFTAILLLAAGFTATAKSYSQQVTLSAKGVPMEKVFREIKRQTGYRIFFNEALMKQAGSVTLNLKKTPLLQALDLCFKDQPLTYTVVGKTIVVKERAVIPQPLAPPTPDINITGRITNNKDEPVIASVMIQGTGRGTTSDADGQYILANVPEKAVLVISATNIETQYISLSKKQASSGVLVLNITAIMKVKQEEEVVFKGYYSESRRLATGSVSRVGAAQIEKQPVGNPLQALKGRMPGVYISQYSGMPGAGFEVQIRGLNSIQNGNKPLYIIDGVPFISETLSDQNTSINMYGYGGVSPLNSINPADIESIEVLKDADATAIYGSRGANGVVLITTKQGKAGKIKVDINASYGSSKVTRFIKPLQTAEYVAMRKQAAANDGDGIKSWEYDITGAWDANPFTDWQKVMIGNTAPFTKINTSLSGGSEETRFLLGVSYDKQGVVFIGNDAADRYATHLSVTHTSANKRFNASLSVKYITNKSNIVATDLTNKALMLAPNSPSLYDSVGKLNWAKGTWTNPVADLANRFRANTYNFLSSAELGYTIAKGLQIKANLGINDIRNEERRTFSSDTYNPSWGLGSQNSSLLVASATGRSWIIEPQINWQAKSGKSKWALLVGGTLQNKMNESTRNNYRSFPSNALIDDPRSAATATIETYSFIEYKYAAMYGRINYNWDDKYIVNLTGRRDGSSRFGPGRKFANFGAAGLAWIFSNEAFMNRASPWLSLGKLRGSYGTTGNDQIGDYRYLDAYSAGGQYQGITGLAPTQLFNPDYGWETNKKLTVAADLGFANDRILFTAEYYRNRSSNQLINYNLSTLTGNTSILRNFPATVQNTGVELSISTINIRRGPVTWSSAFNLSFPRNKLVAFPGIETSSYASIYSVGQPLSISKLFHYTGVDPVSGLYQFEDVNKDGLLSADDYSAIVKKGPIYLGGINNSFSYKGFQFDVFFHFVHRYGNRYVNNGVPGVPDVNQPANVWEGRWQHPGDIATRQKFSRSFDASFAQDRFNASDARAGKIFFARLENVSISWQLPDKWLPNFKCRVFAHGQNLFVITGYNGLDPETGSNILPPLTTIVGGIQLSF